MRKSLHDKDTAPSQAIRVYRGNVKRGEQMDPVGHFELSAEDRERIAAFYASAFQLSQTEFDGVREASAPAFRMSRRLDQPSADARFGRTLSVG